jgi:ATP/maltotriose-dependent transcriptional regulator MalT
MGIAAAHPPLDTPEIGQSSSETLTTREVDILHHLSTGLSNRELSKCLFISERTVKWHIYNLYRKLDVHNRAGAIAAGRKLKIID